MCWQICNLLGILGLPCLVWYPWYQITLHHLKIDLDENELNKKVSHSQCDPQRNPFSGGVEFSSCLRNCDSIQFWLSQSILFNVVSHLFIYHEKYSSRICSKRDKYLKVLAFNWWSHFNLRNQWKKQLKNKTLWRWIIFKKTAISMKALYNSWQLREWITNRSSKQLYNK